MAKTKTSKKPRGKQTKNGRAAARGVGELIRSMIDRDTDVIVAAIRQKFPASKCGPKEIAWYRWKMKKGGGKVKTRVKAATKAKAKAKTKAKTKTKTKTKAKKTRAKKAAA